MFNSVVIVYFKVSARVALIDAGSVTIAVLPNATRGSVCQGALFISVRRTATIVKERIYVNRTLFMNSPPSFFVIWL